MSGRPPNRLIREKSPYLRQHAHNPVAWHPWGDEAFQEAARADKPVFLSIGYSACHWCHVMERESFSDEEVGRLMNENFVSVKVDREERPDIDSYYMTVCQLLTGSGGWPLTVILTPDKRPFFAATYLPRESRFGLIGLKDLIGRVAEAWRSRRPALLESAAGILDALAGASGEHGAGELTPSVLDAAASELSARFDEEFGGFDPAPKFPTPHHLFFLLRRAKRKPGDRALAMVEKTLQAMRRGGIFDQLGFGFHRYSTDRRWLVPHFEKMLYDQALLAMAYTEAFQFTGREEYRQTANEILTYVHRDLRSPEGAFYTAEDADSEGEEGKFYVWELAEIEAVLSSSEADLAKKTFGLSPEGNFTGPEGRPSGKNILHLARLPDEAAPPGASREETARIRDRLFRRRAERPHPFRDTKVLADWNGLIIAALAKAAQAFSRADYVEPAATAAEFIFARMTTEGKLRHRWAEGEASIPALLDDYAFLIWGLLELYGATFEPGFLRRAAGLTEEVIGRFWDGKDGGFFFTPSDSAPDLPLRRKEFIDGALPSGNSVMMFNLVRLGRMLGKADWEAKAEELSRAFSAMVSQYPAGYTQFLGGLDFALGPAKEIVIVGKEGAADTRAMLSVLRTGFFPNIVILFRPGQEPEPEIVSLAPFTKEMKALGERATVYVCSGFRCDRPTTNPGELRSRLI
jgi:uncharacterized protein YyaL (SSP411 family)